MGGLLLRFRARCEWASDLELEPGEQGRPARHLCDLEVEGTGGMGGAAVG